MDTELDIVVIGAGPAGVAAAITAAMAGLKTVIIVKSIGRINPMNEPLQSIHPGLETLLKSFNAEKAIRYSLRAVYSGIHSNGHFMPLSTGDQPWYGYHICRSSFDNYLSFCARKYNIEILTGDLISKISLDQITSRITLKSGRILRCLYIIDATGRSRLLGKKFKVEEEYYSPPLTTWSGVVHNIEPSFFENTGTSFIVEASGWTWLAPEPPSRCTWTRLSLTKKVVLKGPEQLNMYNDGNEIKSANVRWRIFQQLVFNRILLTGDAAGILDPGSGQGILNACWSGLKAAGAVISILNSGRNETDSLKEYQNWFLESYLSKAKRLKEYYFNLGIFFNE